MDGRRIAFGLAVVSLILPVTNVFVTKPAAALVAASSPPFAWDLETVDANRDTGLSTSVALTDAGVPYISYIDSTQRLLRVAHRTPTNWSSEIVAGPGSYAGNTNIAIGPGNAVQVSYFNQTSNAVFFAASGPSGWTTTRIDSGFSEGWNRFAIDPAGRPGIVYTGFDGSLRLASWNGTGWSIEVIDSTTVTSRYPDLAFDALSQPRISYYGSGTLLYAEKSDGRWTRSVIDGTEGAGLFSRIRLDSNGAPHIAYYASRNTSLMYATGGTTGWTRSLVDSGGDVGIDLSLTVDSADRPHIAYYQRTSGTLRYAIGTVRGWIRETVDNSGVVGWYTGIATDSRGFPHISYYDWTDRSLRYARGKIALQVRSLPASPIDLTSVTLTGELVAFGNHSEAMVKFELRVVDGEARTLIVGNVTKPGTFSFAVANLSTDAVYEFQAIARAGNETSRGTNLTFRLTAPSHPFPLDVLLVSVGVGVGSFAALFIAYFVRGRRRGKSKSRD